MNPIIHKPGAIYSKPCLVIGMPNSEYHAHPGISNSGLAEVNQSPSHYKHKRPKEPTRAMEIGTAIHAAVLEPERYKSEYILLPEVKARTATEYKSAVKIHGSERVLVMQEIENVEGMYNAARSNTYVNSRISEDGHNELSVFAFDPETGVLCKCRFDYLSNSLRAIDLKKTQDARTDAFSRSIYNYRYHVQSAFYSDVFYWATGKTLESFEFLAIEEKAPHGMKLYELDADSFQIGREQYRVDLNTYAECLENNNWPIYDCSETEEISLPGWAFNKLNEVELNLEGGEYV